MKGHTNNPNGRPKGIPNKANADLRQWLNDFVNKNTTQIENDWKTLKPAERFQLFEKLLRYCLPQQNEITIDETLCNDLSNLTFEELYLLKYNTKFVKEKED